MKRGCASEGLVTIFQMCVTCGCGLIECGRELDGRR